MMAHKDMKSHLKSLLEEWFGPIREQGSRYGKWTWDGSAKAWKWSLDEISPVKVAFTFSKKVRGDALKLDNGLVIYNDRPVERLVDPLLETLPYPNAQLHRSSEGDFLAKVQDHPFALIWGKGMKKLLPVWGQDIMSGFVELILPHPKEKVYLPLARFGLNGQWIYPGPISQL